MSRNQTNSRLLLPENVGQNRTKPMSGYLIFMAGFFSNVILVIAAFGCLELIWSYLPENSNITSCPPSPVPSCQKRVVGYYSGWEYREITDAQLSKLTHVIFSFINVNSTGQFSFDSEGKEALFLRMKEKANTAGVKVMISVEYVRDGARDPSIEKILNFIQTHDIDGVDFFFDWNKTSLIEMTIDAMLIKDLRSEFAKVARDRRRKDPYLISIKPPIRTFTEANLDALLGYVDFINMHSMNYEKYWKSGHGIFSGPPLTLRAGIHSRGVDDGMKNVACASRSPSRLNIPINFYWFCWWSETEGTLLPYRRKNTIGWKSKIRTYTENTTVDYDGKTLYILYENEESIREKMEYVEEKKIGGIVIWKIEFDDDELTLLSAVASKTSCIDDRNPINYDCYL